jgi:anti-sigma B factor antagonist
VTRQPFIHECELPSRLESLSTIHPVIEKWTAAAGLDRVRSHRAAVAISEAITNAIIHAHEFCDDRTVLVRLWTDADRLCAEIGDRGPWPWRVPPPQEPVTLEQTGGRGLALIRVMTDEFTIEPRPGGGTLIRMLFLDAGQGSADTGTTKTESGVGTVITHSEQGELTMDYRVEKHDDVDVLRISGRLDLVSSNNLKDCVRQRLDEKRTLLVLNMKGVDFINSSGLGALVSILKDVRLVNGRLVLSELAPYVQEIFEITQLSHVFEIHPTEAQAVQGVTLRHEPELVKN